MYFTSNLEYRTFHVVHMSPLRYDPLYRQTLQSTTNRAVGEEAQRISAENQYNDDK